MFPGFQHDIATRCPKTLFTRSHLAPCSLSPLHYSLSFLPKYIADRDLVNTFFLAMRFEFLRIASTAFQAFS
jgi:hypothetical protein